MRIIVGEPIVIGPADDVSFEQRFQHTHEQTQAQNVWLIEHGLGYDPAGVTVVDEQGNLHWPVITYPVPNVRIRLDFQTPVRGICRLS